MVALKSRCLGAFLQAEFRCNVWHRGNRHQNQRSTKSSIAVSKISGVEFQAAGVNDVVVGTVFPAGLLMRNSSIMAELDRTGFLTENARRDFNAAPKHRSGDLVFCRMP